MRIRVIGFGLALGFMSALLNAYQSIVFQGIQLYFAVEEKCTSAVGKEIVGDSPPLSNVKAPFMGSICTRTSKHVMPRAFRKAHERGMPFSNLNPLNITCRWKVLF